MFTRSLYRLMTRLSFTRECGDSGEPDRGDPSRIWFHPVVCLPTLRMCFLKSCVVTATVVVYSYFPLCLCNDSEMPLLVDKRSYPLPSLPSLAPLSRHCMLPLFFRHSTRCRLKIQACFHHFATRRLYCCFSSLPV
jgi:hypothetical protein